SVRANHRSSMDGDAMTDLGAIVQHDIGKQASVVADLRIVAHMISTHQHGSSADLNVRANYAVGSDMSRWINLRGSRNFRARIDSGRVFLRWEKDRQQPRDGDAAVRNSYQRLF